MSKYAFIQLPLVINSLELKKQVLIFDKIFFIKESYEFGIQLGEIFAKKIPSVFMRNYNFTRNNVEFLVENNLLQLLPSEDIGKLSEVKNEEEYKSLEDELKQWGKTTDNYFMDENLNFKQDDLKIEDYDRFLNFIVRIYARCYSYTYNDDYIPIIKNFQKSEKTKLHSVYRILLQSIPEPKESVSWEQIIDFKSDPETKTKYYRLVNWANEMSSTEFPVSQIEEKYKELLFEYTQLFKAHKMKHNFGTIEFVTKIISQAASLRFDKIHETLFSISKERANLLDAESKFEGKQLAYIHKLKQNF